MLTRRIITCLEHAGRSEAIAEVLTQEIPFSRDYLGLATHFAENQQLDQAMKWIEMGFSSSGVFRPFGNNGLWNLYDSILRRRRMWPRVMTLRVERFLLHPTTEQFRECLKVARRLKCETEVRGLLLEFLEDGAIPWLQDWWAFPSSGLPLEFGHKQKKFPRLQNLLEIALLEKQEAEILSLYQRMATHREPLQGDLADRTANALKKTAPDRSIEIWQEKAEDLIRLTKPQAYRTALTPLRKVRDLLHQLERQGEWSEYLAKIRFVNKRKSRLLKMLERL